VTGIKDSTLLAAAKRLFAVVCGSYAIAHAPLAIAQVPPLSAPASSARAQASPPLAQAPGAIAPMPSAGMFCGAEPLAAFCSAVRGARAEGWPAQSRSEVMAQHGMVVTSQPLAAQAGLQILMHGGNAIDAAVATAAVLNVMEPMMEGMGGDLFALVYIAKKKGSMY
jgi:hypothetical protein